MSKHKRAANNSQMRHTSIDRNRNSFAMHFLNVTLDTQRMTSSDLKTLLRNGQVLHISGTLNLRWEEFSALHLAQDTGLDDVVWDAVSDDTPGSLELTVLYPQLEEDRIRSRIAETSGIEEYEIQSEL